MSDPGLNFSVEPAWFRLHIFHDPFHIPQEFVLDFEKFSLFLKPLRRLLLVLIQSRIESSKTVELL